MKTKLKDYYKSILLEGKFDETSKAQFREDIKHFGRFGEHIYNSRGMNEVSEAVKNLAERASAMALDEAGDWFDAITVKKNMQEVKKDAVLFEKTAKEMGALQQRLEAVYEDMAHKLGRYYEVGDLAGKDVLPADNDYTANGEEGEEENGEDMEEQATNTPTLGGFKQDTGKQGVTPPQTGTTPPPPPPTNQPPTPPGGGLSALGAVPGMGAAAGAAGMAANKAAGNPGQNLVPLGDLMSDDEINNVKENYWTLQGAQKSLMEDDEGVTADEGAPGIAVNKSTEWKARNESRADFFTRMKEQLENL